MNISQKRKTFYVVTIVLGFTYFMMKESSIQKINLDIAKKEIMIVAKPSVTSNKNSISNIRIMPNQGATSLKYFLKRKLDLKNNINDAELLEPHISALQELSQEELHHTPSILLIFAQAIGTIKTALKNNPDSKQLNQIANEYFESCSLNEELLDSARSLCLANLLLSHSDKLVNLKPYPTNIILLSQNILDL